MAEHEPRAVPLPGEKIHLRYKNIDPGNFHRFHMSEFHPTHFNDTPNGRGRFSPIRNLNGEIIPTLYAAQTLECAAMETIFRDLAYIPAPRHIDMVKFAGFLHSEIRVERPLRLVDLTAISLTALGMTRRDLIDTDASRYAYTQQWAEAIHAYAPDAQGLFWISRQDDTSQVIVLFGDRVEDEALLHIGRSLRILHDEPTWSSLLDVLDVLDVDAEF
ncbi:hypothetical protein PS910_02655 [Pseudomonas fluorescens]|nr:hypothetical protein PS910_02655 [Pseudomonas fluorescens]